MAESLKDVIAKLKAQQQGTSQTSQPISQPIKKEEIEEEEEEVEEIPEQIQKSPVMPSNEVPEASKKEQMAKQVFMEIELLQNDGRFRLELLRQLQEINKALVVIAEILVDKRR